MPVLAILGVVLFLAFLVEALTEYVFGQICNHVEKLIPYKWLLIYVSMAIGIVGAFVYRFDLLSLLGEYIGADIPVTPYGITITGVSIGRGANFLHDTLKYFTKPQLPE